MDGDNLWLVEESESPVYNIRHRSFYLAKNVILFVSKQKYDKLYFSLFDQLIRIVSSIGANLVEGFAGSSKNDFVKFYTIALKSANETKYWLCLIKETLDFDEDDKIQKFIKETDEISKIIATIIINTKK
jgi:four helix bundle protein